MDEIRVAHVPSSDPIAVRFAEKTGLKGLFANMLKKYIIFTKQNKLNKEGRPC
jgi:hypothetical protein